jgi:hypothetical protein
MTFYSSNRSGEPDEKLELDLTNSHLHSLEEVEIRDSLEVCYPFLIGLWTSEKFRWWIECGSRNAPDEYAVRGSHGQQAQGN